MDGDEWGGPDSGSESTAEYYPDAGSGASSDPSALAGWFTGTSDDTEWQSRSGATVGVVENDPTVVHERGADHSELEAGGEQWERRHFERCRFTDAMLVGLQTRSCSFVEC